jgi:hypothetical protein
MTRAPEPTGKQRLLWGETGKGDPSPHGLARWLGDFELHWPLCLLL